MPGLRQMRAANLIHKGRTSKLRAAGKIYASGFVFCNHVASERPWPHQMPTLRQKESPGRKRHSA